MVPLTAAQLREQLATKIPQELRPLVTQMLWSAHDGGVSSGLAKQARILNPFESLLPPPMQEPTKPRR